MKRKKKQLISDNGKSIYNIEYKKRNWIQWKRLCWVLNGKGNSPCYLISAFDGGV